MSGVNTSGPPTSALTAASLAEGVGQYGTAKSGAAWQQLGG